VVDSFGAVTIVMEIRDGHTGEALLRYGRRQHLVGGMRIGSDPAKGSVLSLAFRDFVIDFQRAFTRSLPRLPPIARMLTCAQRAGLAPFTPEADAVREIEEALALTPDLENGQQIYQACASCHQPQGTGLSDGSVPRLTGQHRSVVIKQLADIRAGNRDNPTMYPFASASRIGGSQAIADVSGYIGTLEVSGDTGKGPGDDLELGKQVYARECAGCHGERGEGDAERSIPRIQSQHYAYLVRQFQWIRDGRRRNADPAMQAQIMRFGDDETRAVLDYVSRLDPSTGE
jgi:cytochrome c553